MFILVNNGRNDNAMPVNLGNKSGLLGEGARSRLYGRTECLPRELDCIVQGVNSAFLKEFAEFPVPLGAGGKIEMLQQSLHLSHGDLLERLDPLGAPQLRRYS